MSKQNLADIRKKMEKLIQQEKELQEKLALDIGQYFVKNEPNIETLRDFKQWYEKANDAINYMMNTREEPPVAVAPVEEVPVAHSNDTQVNNSVEQMNYAEENNSFKQINFKDEDY